MTPFLCGDIAIIKLTYQERKARALLIRVAKGLVNTHKIGLISYKEFWRAIDRRSWGRARKDEIVKIVSNISTCELRNARPPLNELVVRKDSHLPGEPWENIKQYHEERYGVDVPYTSHRDAQEACWKFWALKNKKGTLSEIEAEEGYQQDRRIKFKSRNARIISQRKKRDDYTCQACDFRMKLNGKLIIDCHHINPIGKAQEVIITAIDDLICLCPTCHRISHTRKYPLTVNEIKELLE